MTTKQELEKARKLLDDAERDNRETQKLNAKAKMKSLIGTYWKIDNDQLHRDDTLLAIRYYGSESSLRKQTWFWYHDTYYGVSIHDSWHSADTEDADIQISEKEFNQIKQKIIDKMENK